MNQRKKGTAKNVFSTFISLTLAVCLIFSSLTAFTSNLHQQHLLNKTAISSALVNQDYVQHAIPPEIKLIAEIVDIEEEEDFVLKKKSVIVHAEISTLWSYSFSEAAKQSALVYFKSPIIKSAEPCYIEFCSLKIPL